MQLILNNSLFKFSMSKMSFHHIALLYSAFCIKSLHYFLQTFQSPVCIRHFQHTLVPASHIARAQRLHMSSNCCIGQRQFFAA